MSKLEQNTQFKLTADSLYTLEAPALNFDEGIPSSSQFGDVYFSRDDGLAESEYIFIQHNKLPERWKNWSANEFVIGETGFGTGLNFLAACKLWLEIAPKQSQLHFISTELFPLTREQLIASLALWPSLATEAAELIQQYPVRLGGMHVIPLFNNRIILQLHFGDAAESFSHIISPAQGLVDAWFLDGFSPAKNPDMWHEALFAQIGRLTKKNGTAATFTVAGIVKNGLRNVGFSIEKVAGHGRKRQMLKAIYPIDKTPYANPLPFWAKLITSTHPNQHQHVTIIGAGLAGCTTANALAKRGFRVTIYERESHLAAGASGNSQGVLYNTLSPTPNKVNLFSLYSFLYSYYFYKQLVEENAHIGQLCGQLELIRDEKEHDLAEKLAELLTHNPDLFRYLNKEEASLTAGVRLDNPAIYFPKAGWLSPAEICKTLTQHENISVKFNTEVSELLYEDNVWHLLDNQHDVITQSDIVVIANADQAKNYEQTSWLPIKKIRGQTTTIPCNSLTRELKTVICHDGYISPAMNDEHCIGATFDLHNQSSDCLDSDDVENIQSLLKAIPILKHAAYPRVISNRVAFRTTSTDYLPICGPVPKFDDFIRDYDRLRYDARFDIEIPGSYWPNLYLNSAHGARGLSYTPLCAELLASTITDTTRPMTANMSLELHPARFIVKNIIRNKIIRQI